MVKALYRFFCAPRVVEGHLFRGCLLPMYELKVISNYSVLYNDLFMTTLALLILPMLIQIIVVHDRSF